MSGVGVHSNVLLGAAAALALLSFGITSWFYANSEELKHIHKRIDRLVRSVAQADNKSVRVSASSISSSRYESSPPTWIIELRNEVESLKSKNKFLEEEIKSLRKDIQTGPQERRKSVTFQTPPVVVEYTVPPLPPPLLAPFNLPPPLPPVPSHLSRQEWLKAAEELVWCTDEERKDKKAEIEEAMSNMPAVVAIIQELFQKSAGALGAEDKHALTQEYGDKLYNMLVMIYGDMSRQ